MAALKSKRLKGELSDLDDKFVVCRARLRHRWEDIPFNGRPGAKWQTTASTTVFAARCLRCGTVREEAWNNYSGDILAVRYIYPKGPNGENVYSLDGEIRPINVRKEYLDRRRSSSNGKFAKL